MEATRPDKTTKKMREGREDTGKAALCHSNTQNSGEEEPVKETEKGRQVKLGRKLRQCVLAAKSRT